MLGWLVDLGLYLWDLVGVVAISCSAVAGVFLRSVLNALGGWAYYIWDLVANRFIEAGVLEFLARDVVGEEGWALIGPFMVLFPVGQAVTILLTTFGIAGTIRLARWLKAWIPTIGD